MPLPAANSRPNSTQFGLVARYEMAWRAFIRAVKANFDDLQPRDNLGKWTLVSGVEISGDFLTGIPTIDDTSIALSRTLARIMHSVSRAPGMSAQTYGIAVHVAFGLALRIDGPPGVGDIEHSFTFDGSDAYYGLAGTVRTDATLRNITGDVLAIYDVKTGNKKMSRARADRLREATGASPSTPVFELHVNRGINRKSIWMTQFWD